MRKGLDLMMSMDHNDDWLRTSDNTARRKTDYEKQLEEAVTGQRYTLALHKRFAETYRVQRKILGVICIILALLLVIK